MKLPEVRVRDGEVERISRQRTEACPGGVQILMPAQIIDERHPGTEGHGLEERCARPIELVESRRAKPRALRQATDRHSVRTFRRVEVPSRGRQPDSER